MAHKVLRHFAHPGPISSSWISACPLVGGQDVCRLIRKESEEVPILILSGSAAEVDRVLLLELGADDYVTKPFSPKELVARVRAVLRRSRRPAPVEQTPLLRCLGGFPEDGSRPVASFRSRPRNSSC